MTKKEWSKLSAREQERIASKNEHRATKIYQDGKEDKPIPVANCIVYCHGTNTHGWIEINNPDELGFEALIAESWILVADLMP